MAFSFGFSADDAGSDLEDAADPETHTASNAAAAARIPAKSHKLEDLVGMQTSKPLVHLTSRTDLSIMRAELLQAHAWR